MKYQNTLITSDPEQTEAAGAELARLILSTPTLPRFVALYGDLGVGKTAFVRGFASVVSPTSAVRSPTFALVHEYRGTPCPLFHFDMYRIETLGELYSVGFFEYLERGGVCAIEWSENIYSALPDDSVFVVIEKIDETTRKITVKEGKE